MKKLCLDKKIWVVRYDNILVRNKNLNLIASSQSLCLGLDVASSQSLCLGLEVASSQSLCLGLEV